MATIRDNNLKDNLDKAVHILNNAAKKDVINWRTTARWAANRIDLYTLSAKSLGLLIDHIIATNKGFKWLPTIQDRYLAKLTEVGMAEHPMPFHEPADDFIPDDFIPDEPHF